LSYVETSVRLVVAALVGGVGAAAAFACLMLGP
jgi:hypothetical protein